MKLLPMALCMALILAAAQVLAQEQKPGQPLYFPREEVKEHPSDLAPETDPYWEEEKARRQREGEPLEEVYEEPTESYYEETVRYERVEKEKKYKQPRRWE